MASRDHGFSYGRRSSEFSLGEATVQTSWFENVLLQNALKESQRLASKEALPKLTKERRASIRYGAGALAAMGLGGDVAAATPASPSRQRMVQKAKDQRVEDFLRECRDEALTYIAAGSVTSGGSQGMGQAYTIEDIPAETLASLEPDRADHHKIGELPSTAICGNDITASCFYVVGELSKNAGAWGPVCTLLSSFTLYCFRSIYGEVVTALPLNGGIYNLLLNSSTKRTASVTACLTILSYTATGVVSSVTAANYMKCSPLFAEIQEVPVAVVILGFFAGLMLLGMTESSNVASLLFIFHLSVLALLAVFSVFVIYDNGLDMLYANLAWQHQPPVLYSVFFGFSSAMLGVSGFETSANFVEEQKPGVFPKTLTNMWLSVSAINIILPLLAICIIPLDDLVGPKSSYALAMLAERVGGSNLRDVVALDALCVLAGSVLTSYVGVVGLFQRMAGDRCLPDFFSITNTWRGTPHYTIMFFFAVCSSMCILLKGDITQLGAIYSISFLLVMGLFAFCGLWMKVKRPTLPRQIHTHPAMFALGLFLVSIAFTAVVLLHPDMLTYFYVYYGITVVMVMTTFARVSLFTAALRILHDSQAVRSVLKFFVRMDVAQHWILTQLQALRSQSVVYFTKNANLSQINMALQYIEDNEEARYVRIIHVFSSDDKIPKHLLEYVQLLDCVYPSTRIDCILVKGEFCPAIVQYISKRIHVAVNCMFINCPKHDFKHPLDTMGGLRVIQSSEKGSLLDDLKDKLGGSTLKPIVDLKIPLQDASQVAPLLRTPDLTSSRTRPGNKKQVALRSSLKETRSSFESDSSSDEGRGRMASSV
eukprot:TRINITY_DN8835_c0_g1_i4.p1 TRINITY_DN8835_c0_g1~~TRINITY_DN8835_c0_g1_i4.p1  ORF type:complete len:823 (+),score=107.50 TRINITY_DN8835_c0_g1_i4:114-2582(+)